MDSCTVTLNVCSVYDQINHSDIEASKASLNTALTTDFLSD